MIEGLLAGTVVGKPPSSRAYLVKVCVTTLEVTPDSMALTGTGEYETCPSLSNVPRGWGGDLGAGWRGGRRAAAGIQLPRETGGLWRGCGTLPL